MEEGIMHIYLAFSTVYEYLKVQVISSDFGNKPRKIKALLNDFGCYSRKGSLNKG